jgi:Bacteriophytochrome (light-regulated signal transduction histidine kinase)
MVLSTWLRRVRPGGLLIVMIAFYAAVAVTVAIHAAWTDLAATRKAGEAATAIAARLLEERASRILDASEHVALRMGERIAVSGLAALSVASVSDLLEGTPYLANILVLDPEGRLVVQGRGEHPGSIDLSDRAWVRGASAAGAATFVGDPGLDVGSRAVTFAVARRIDDRGGDARALVAVLVDVDAFKPFLQRLDSLHAPALGISRLDGRELVRQPWRGNEPQRSLEGSTLFSRQLPMSTMGTFRDRSSYDGVERVVSYRVIAARDLVVWVGENEAEALSAWRQRAWGVAGLTALSVAVMAGLTLLLLRELSRERRASAELVSLNRDLERSNADLEQFAYIASHDLKEPLRNIASYVQLLQRRYQGRLDPDADAFIGYTVDGVRRLQSIINELLAYSRIGTGQMVLAPVQAGALVSTALAHLKGVIAEAQAAVEVKGPLPVVEADAAQLGSLFQNLIANALKYRREDVRAEVTMGCEDRGEHWAFYVRDNGIGIDAQYHRQIFDLFKRLHPRDRYPGTGIGLAICQRVAERHGGRIWVDSAVGQGSTFWFSLPKNQSP